MKKLVKVKSFIVDRDTWYRGKGPSRSRLLKGDGTMCCAGFYAKACGLSDRSIRHKETLAEVRRHFKDEELRSQIRNENEGMTKIYETNDRDDIGERERERTLRKLFKDRGVTLKFTGGR